MPGPIFTINTSDLRLLIRFYRKAPFLFSRTVTNLINSFAFGTRAVSINFINKYMTVRSPGFVRSSIRVKKASFRTMTAIVGSIRRPRFTGWIEQELGTPVQRTRIFGIMARGGDIKRRTIGVSRLRQNADHIEPDAYEGRSERFRNTAMLMDIRRRGIKKPFVIRRHSKLKPGLYRFVRKKLQMLQRFKVKVQPKRIPWLSGSVKLYMSKNRVRNEWAKSIRHVLKLK